MISILVVALALVSMLSAPSAAAPIEDGAASKEKNDTTTYPVFNRASDEPNVAQPKDYDCGLDEVGTVKWDKAKKQYRIVRGSWQLPDWKPDKDFLVPVAGDKKTPYLYLCPKDSHLGKHPPRKVTHRQGAKLVLRPPELCAVNHDPHEVDMSKLRPRLGAFETSSTSGWTHHARMTKLLAELVTEERGERALKGAVAVGFNSASTPSGKDNLDKFKVSGEIKRGRYPSEFEFAAQILLQLREGELQEEVSVFRTDYEHHPHEKLEVYGFAERFSNSFLSIDQRYEVGGGMYWSPIRLGLRPIIGRSPSLRILEDPFPLDEAWRYLNCGKSRADSQNEGGQQGAGTPEGCAEQERTAALKHAGAAPTSEDLKTLEFFRVRAINSVEYREARVTMGVALSLMAEIEKASIETTAIGEQGESSPFIVDLLAERTFRLTVRPTLLLRATDRATLRVHPYFKFRISDFRDVRKDIFATLEYRLGDIETIGGEVVTLALNYHHHLDSHPPSITAANLSPGQELQRLTRTQAEGDHRVLAFELKVGWGG